MTMNYPSAPGYKVAGPSREAANDTVSTASTLREQALRSLKECGPMTADECADWMFISILAIRPRFSELRVLGIIEDTGLRRPNASGHRATVWRIKANPPLKQSDLL